MFSIELKKNERSRENVIENFKKDNKPVVVYGSGKFGLAAANALMENDIEILAFLVDDIYYEENLFCDVHNSKIVCLDRKNIENLSVEYNICLGIIDYRLLNSLKKEFKNCSYIDYLDAIPSHILSVSYFEENKLLLNELYDCLSDDLSKQVMENFFYARYSGDVYRYSFPSLFKKKAGS